MKRTSGFNTGAGILALAIALSAGSAAAQDAATSSSDAIEEIVARRPAAQRTCRISASQ